MPITPPPGDAVIIDFRALWSVPAGDAVIVNFRDDDTPGPPDPPPRWQFARAAAAWQHTPRRQVAARLLFAGAPARRAVLGLVWSRAGRCDAAPQPLRWGDIPRRWLATGLQWAFSAPLPLLPTALRWGLIPKRQAITRLLWSGNLPRRDAVAAVPWTAPPIQRVRVDLAWRDVPRMGVCAGTPWALPPQREVRPVLPWGLAPAVRWFINSPGIDPPDDSPPWQYEPPPGDAVIVDFSCPPVASVLAADALVIDFGRAACYLAWPRPRRYIVLNSAQVVRLPERTPIPVTGGSIRSSRDKATHDIQLTLADPAALELLRPVPEPKTVEINLNGHVWTGIIESWDDNRRHLGDGGRGREVTVSGRSRVALLGAPYAPARSLVVTADRQSQQLIDDELALTDFTADVPSGWTWLVTGGAWTYDGKTRLDAIQDVAGAAGAVVISHPWDDVLLIRPQYPVSPWSWSVTAADVEVPDDVIYSITRGSGTGARDSETITLPLWPPSASDKPRLIEPLDLVKLVTAAPYKGLAASVDITFGMQGSGGGAQVLVIEQRVTLDLAPAVPAYNQVLVSGTHAGVSDPIIRTGTAGDVRMASIVDPLITTHAAAAERGRNALAAGTADRAATNLWRSLRGLEPAGPTRKGTVTAANADGSYTIATTDGATIRARSLPGATWTQGDGVITRDGIIIDTAPGLPSVTQYV